MLFARVENDVTTISPEKKLHLQFWPIFFDFLDQKQQFSLRGLLIIWPRKSQLWGRGGVTSKLASQCPSYWGIYKHAPNRFLF